MAGRFEWTKEAYERSASSRCWWFTPYDTGWDGCHQYGADIRSDNELRQIARMEWELGPIPDWAKEFIDKSVHLPPPCGHYLFPLQCLEAVSAIGSETPPVFVHGCYTAERGRKERALDYLFCLDAWLAGADPETASRELAMRANEKTGWSDICRDLWYILGERTETKELLTERALHRYRWWVKTLTWDDDARNLFARDRYLGDVRGSGDSYGNPAYRDPYFVELEAPQVTRIEARLAEIGSNSEALRADIEDSWLCGPKSFRWLERIIWQIGQGRGPEDGEKVPGFLRCEETYPDRAQAVAWWQGLLAALDGWWRGKLGTGDPADEVNSRLGQATPVKRWLVRLYARRLRLLQQYAPIGQLVSPPSSLGRRWKFSG